MDKRLDTKNSAGFTLMEIVVATTIFAIISAALMSLFNETLKINRRSEALRQATQGMRNFVEFLVKEVRNGKVDYFIVNGTIPGTPLNTWCADKGVGNSTYSARDNWLAVTNLNGEEECFYLGYGSVAAPGKNYKDYVGTGVFTYDTNPSSLTYNPAPVLVMQKRNGTAEVLNPPNFRIENLMFVVRPTCDPYSNCVAYGNSTPKIQPAVTIFIKFAAKLPTGEEVPIIYQTSVSTQDYNIPGT
jgi:prepilin-type N-terminal cleavage/methylation domain-containing protein